MANNRVWRALVVDDEVMVRRLLHRALSQEGFVCDSANDGNDAVKMVAANYYDAVVTDLKMPNQHGHALATHLLAMEPRPVVVVHTGVMEPRLAKDLIGRGVDDILFKPTDFSVLAAKVKALVDRRYERPGHYGMLPEAATGVPSADSLGSVIAEQTQNDVELLPEPHSGRRPLAAASVEDVVTSGDSTVSAAESGPVASGKRSPNRRNGHSRKTVRSGAGELTTATPRDRDGTFEPQLIGKQQRRLPGFDEKILTLYANGMTTRDNLELVSELYGIDASATLISEITAELDAKAVAWRRRPLAAVWPIIYFDGIVVHIRGANGRVSPHTVFFALGVNLDGYKELLGIWLAENEGVKFWLACLTDLKNRGLHEIFVACTEGLSGFSEAIQAAYPEATEQLCIVHLVRAALRYVSVQDSRAVTADLKKVYGAATVVEAEQALASFAHAWDGKYPTISKQWRARWTDIITLFDFPPAIRRVIYTTNTIESVNSAIRKFTRKCKLYPNEDSALTIVYMAVREASSKWTMPIRRWKEALNQFAILFEDRLPQATIK